MPEIGALILPCSGLLQDLFPKAGGMGEVITEAADKISFRDAAAFAQSANLSRQVQDSFQPLQSRASNDQPAFLDLSLDGLYQSDTYTGRCATAARPADVSENTENIERNLDAQIQQAPAPEEGRDVRLPSEKLQDFLGAAAKNATNPDNYKQYIPGELEKLVGVAEGLNIAKEQTKGAAAAGWKFLTDGTVADFLSKPNAINEPLLNTVGNVLDAMAEDPNAVNHATSKALEALGTAVIQASEHYSALPDREKGHVIGEAMFAMVNPEGSTKSGEAALKIADIVATHVDKSVVEGIQKTLQVAEDAARTSPELAQAAKQFLRDYTKQLGMTPQEMELAGIPKGYFDGMQPPAGAGNGDNFFAMSKADESEGVPKKSAQSAGDIRYQVDNVTGRLQRTDLGKVREPYNWEAINERFSSDVVRQFNEDSCISAVGDMLSEGKVTQQELIARLGERPDITDLVDILGTGWTSEKRSFKSLAEIGEHGPWAAELMENSGTELEKSLHTVMVDGVNSSGNVVIRDPWEGTTYEMTPKKFLKDWTTRAVYRKR